MASRRTSSAPNSFKNTSTDANSSKCANNGVKANNTADGKKTGKSSGTIVKSRYLQSAEKTSLSKSNSLTNELTGPSSPKPTSVKPKVGAPKRHSKTPQALAESTLACKTDASFLGKSVLQSTFSDGHYFRPDFDISVIKDKTVIENAKEPERTLESEKKNIEMQTFLLAYLTAKMESNTAKFKAEAVAKLLQNMEEEQRLHRKVKEKKHQHLLMEKKKQLNELLDLQIDILTPVAEAANQFTKDYKCFAAAVDSTRHELPVKNFYIHGDGKEFLEKAEVCLKETEILLQDCTQGDHLDHSTSLECLREIKTISKDISQQLSGTCSELLELSSLVCRQSVQLQQAIEEEELGSSRTLLLFCPKQ
ncbi:HAUS augmin-like complex subunit 8 [Gambusia affinis]|uniref:HAUS augmin-like complex subunit 8 n=1 Tax=Gambusia affinis TaxID=33528 RepID=UPI001CDB8312|nr:HAUS augmin-like complex subunit 8 [Gambusia affinis]